jgi:hypothetical protein
LWRASRGDRDRMKFLLIIVVVAVVVFLVAKYGVPGSRRR